MIDSGTVLAAATIALVAATSVYAWATVRLARFTRQLKDATNRLEMSEQKSRVANARTRAVAILETKIEQGEQLLRERKEVWVSYIAAGAEPPESGALRKLAPLIDGAKDSVNVEVLDKIVSDLDMAARGIRIFEVVPDDKFVVSFDLLLDQLAQALRYWRQEVRDLNRAAALELAAGDEKTHPLAAGVVAR
jgi:hypothetical protein